MGRFLSNTINKLDKKGRVSIPAPFRPVLGDGGKLYTFLSVDQPAIEAGGIGLIEKGEEQLARLDPFSREYELYSFVLHGDSGHLNVDGEGRIILNDQIRDHAGIEDKVAFVGRGHFFQLWAPEKFESYREEARASVAAMRQVGIGRGTSNLTGKGSVTQGEQGS